METIKRNINGYEVIFINFGRGDQRLFINNPEGIQIYGHKTSSGIDYLETAKREIAEDMNLRGVAVVETVAAPVIADRMICLSARKDEFKTAMLRGIENDLVVERDVERDSFFVVNTTNSTDYRVKLETRDGAAHASCSCPDFQMRRRLCKHIAEVLQESFFGVTESFGVILK